ncbi:Acyl-CoA-binding domain-containing protein 5 [Linnemannia zychae]|nr:Acyl-CoA-binding domain-containing protein 5 [Linnemannia zychae]
MFDLPDISVAFPGRMKYGNVWSKHLNSVVYWGGENETPLDSALSNAVSQFSMETLAWSTMMTHGTAPGARYYHCMASNEDGKKVVIYGGNLSNDTMAGDLWILDVVTATWTQGVSGPPRINTVCAVAGDQFLIWGGSTPQSIVAPPEMLIYNITASRYVTQYTPPAFYKDLQPPPALSRTTAPWADQELSLRKSPTIIGASVGGSVMLIALFATAFFIRRRRRDGRVKRNSKKAPQETDNDSELERTLKELEDKRNEIEDQKKELDLKRELLVQQHQQSSQMQSALKRASKPMVGESYMLLSPPSAPHQLIPEPISYSHEDLNSRRTVQGVFGPIDMYQGDCYADHNPRRESDMAQDVIEPMYGPSSPVNSAIPDVVYHASPDVGMEWTKQHQDGHPHAVIDTITASNDNIDR